MAAHVQECRVLTPSPRRQTQAITAVHITMATAFLPGSMAVVVVVRGEEGWRDGGERRLSELFIFASPLSTS